ncbi:MAG: HdeD family acid-resistance protein [Actinomycetota bacterium]
MTAVSITRPREAAAGKGWWLLLVSGILWILIGLYVLQAHYGSAVAIGYLTGLWLLFAGAAEFVEAVVVMGWKWAHAVMGALFVIGGIAAFISPFQTFTVLASLIGFFLVLKGTFDFVIALALRHEVDLWWMTLISGIIQIALGVWAIGYPGRSAALLLIWIGVGAIIRGVAEIVAAFHVRKLPEAVLV